MRSSLTTIERKKIFDEVRRLKQSNVNLDFRSLRFALSACFPRLPSKETLKRYLAGKTCPTTSINDFEPKQSEELSFFLGAWLGDGWADESDGGKRLLLKVRSYDFAKEFATSAEKILHKTDSYWVRRIFDKTGIWYLVKVTSFLLYDFVNQPLDVLSGTIEPLPRGFLRGLFTAEGNPSTSISRRYGLDVVLDLSNSDYQLLEFSMNLLLALGYHPRRIRLVQPKGTRTNLGVATKAGWLLKLLRFDDAETFASTIGFADSKKQRKLTDAISLIREFGSIRAAREWTRLYEKQRGDWVWKGRAHLPFHDNYGANLT